jgi:hypothetical protein
VTAPAEAETGISNPGTVTSGSSVTVSAKIDNAVRAELQVAAPGGAYQTIASGGNLLGQTRLSNSVDIPHNGVYKVRLKGSITGTIYDAQSFRVRIPPAAPRGLRASASGNKLVVRWNRGVDNDLSGYQIAASRAASRTASTSSLCSGASCATTMSLPSGAVGTVGAYVRALRSDGSGGVVRSDASSTRTTIPSGTRGSGGAVTPTPGFGGGATGVPGTSSVNPLNPLQSNSPITLPTVGPEGTTPGFQYPTPAPEVAGPEQNAPNAKNVSATSPLQWGKSLAIALILLVIAAHLSMRTRRLRTAEAGSGRGGSRARVREARKQIVRAEAAAKPGQPVGTAEAAATEAAATEAAATEAAATEATATEATAVAQDAGTRTAGPSSVRSKAGKSRSKTGPGASQGPRSEAGVAGRRSADKATKASGRQGSGSYRGRRRAQ